MAENEILDQVDENGNVIGQAKRSEFHSNPDLIHQVVHCWIFNSKGELLWQQRSPKKATSPGKWDMSCGGHILSGDTPDDTLARELEEELGLKNIEFQLADKYVASHTTQTELINLYYAKVDLNPAELTLQKEEVERVEWIKPEDARKLVKDGKRESTDFIFDQVDKILEFMNK